MHWNSHDPTYVWNDSRIILPQPQSSLQPLYGISLIPLISNAIMKEGF